MRCGTLVFSVRGVTGFNTREGSGEIATGISREVGGVEKLGAYINHLCRKIPSALGTNNVYLRHVLVRPTVFLAQDLC
jgi:hypothetical protein